MQFSTSLQTDNHASTPPLSFLQAGCPSCHPTNSVNALKARDFTLKNVENRVFDLEEVVRGVGAVVVREREGGRLEGRYSRRDVAGERELLDAVLVERRRHARRHDHHDRVASCTTPSQPQT